MTAGKIKLGYAPTRRNVFDKAEAKRYKDMIEKRLKEWKIDLVNLDFLNDEGLLFNVLDAKKVADKFIAEGVDGVFVPHCNFGTEDAVGKLCKLVGKPVLLWGPRDDAPEKDGFRKRDSQCGLFATSKVLRRYGATFTYLPNTWVDGAELEHGVKSFVRVCAARKAFVGARIGQIGPRPKPFLSVIVNEGELLERFGIEIVPTTLIDIERGVKEICDKGGKELDALVQDMKSRIEFPKQTDKAIAVHAAAVMWIKKWAEDNGCSAVALQCWSDLVRALGIWPCFVNGELTGMGLPSACEMDIHAAATGLMMQAAGDAPTFTADLTIRHPENENAELLWHCGPFPSCLAEKGAKKKVIGYDAENKVSGLGQWQIKGGPITVGRVDGDHREYQMLMGHVKSTDGPYNRGTYVWVIAPNWLEWEEKFIYGPYIHHVTGVHGHIAPILNEACRYIPGLKADPVVLTENDMRAFWRGQQ